MNNHDVDASNSERLHRQDLQELAEIQQMKVEIWALRGQLETSKLQHDHEKQEIRDLLGAELGDLHNTIRVMRTELELAQQTAQQVHAELSASADLAQQQLRAAVATMRLELEQAHRDRDDALSTAVRHSRDEITHLHDTILALRQKLEVVNDQDS